MEGRPSRRESSVSGKEEFFVLTMRKAEGGAKKCLREAEGSGAGGLSTFLIPRRP